MHEATVERKEERSIPGGKVLCDVQNNRYAPSDRKSAMAHRRGSRICSLVIRAVTMVLIFDTHHSVLLPA